MENNQQTETTQPTIADLQKQVEALKSELTETLAAQKATAERELAEARLAAAAKTTATPKTGGETSGAADLKIEKAIARVGGAAKWGLLSPSQKAESLGLSASAASVDELRRYFGRDSDAKAASQLMAVDPGRYRRLRTLAKLHGVY